MQPTELANDLFGVESNLLGVGTHIGPAEQSARPARQIVALEPFKQGQIDFGVFGNVSERQMLTLTLRAKTGSERQIHHKTPNPKPQIPNPKSHGSWQLEVGSYFSLIG